MPKRGADEAKSTGDENDLLAKAINHCWGDGFLAVFRAYFRKHAHKFEVMAEGKSEEHSLEYQELFNEYLLIFEGKLEEFIAREGSTINQFYITIKEHQSDPDPKVQLFINCLLASADYDSFFNVMKKEGEKSLRQKDHLEHDRKATRGEEKESGMSITRPSVGETKAVEQQRRPVERSYK